MNAYIRKRGNSYTLEKLNEWNVKNDGLFQDFQVNLLGWNQNTLTQSQPRLRARPLSGRVVQNFFANRKPRQTESFINSGYCWVVALTVDKGVANENHPKKECQPGDFTIFCSCCSQKWSYMNSLSKQPVFMSTKHHAKMPKSLQVQY